MKPLTSYQTINDENGQIAFAVIPYTDFVKILSSFDSDTVPNEVVGRHIMDEVSMLQAWREHLNFTQDEIAKLMGISQSGYAQIEAAKRPRKKTLQKAADAMGITLQQLCY